MKPEIKKGMREYIYIGCPRCDKKIEGVKDSEIKNNYEAHEKSCKKKKGNNLTKPKTDGDNNASKESETNPEAISK
jgi:hypothetical protein